MASASSLRGMKTALRKEVRKRLASVPAFTVEKESSAVTARFLESKEYNSSKRVAVYISLPSGEISTTEIIKDIFKKEMTCFIPRCDGTNMNMVKLRSFEDYASLPRNAWNIPEPPLDEDRENALETGGLDLIIMPGLAFDNEGNRLGHGKGYYDRFLARYDIEAEAGGFRKNPTTVAFALSQQILDKVIPHDDLDRRPHLILTANGVLQKPNSDAS